MRQNRATELEAAQGEIVQIRTDAGLLAVDVKKQQAELNDLHLKLAAATAAAETADARTVEIERRAADLRTRCGQRTERSTVANTQDSERAAAIQG